MIVVYSFESTRSQARAFFLVYIKLNKCNNEHKIDHIRDPWIIYQKQGSQNKVLTNIALHVYE